MKITKFILTILLLVLVTSCLSNSNSIKRIFIESFPKKVEFLPTEIPSFDGLTVNVEYNNGNIEELKDYELIYDEFLIGENLVTVKYKDYFAYFIITITKQKETLLDVIDYTSFTTKNVSFDSYYKHYQNVKYAVTRTKDSMIVYDEARPISTNVYGFEVAVDRFGKVIEKDVNVSIPSGGFVISAHGTSTPYLKEIEINDYVLYYHNNLYIYKCDDIVDTNEFYLLLEEAIKNLETIDDIDLYNKNVKKLNNIIKLINSGDVNNFDIVDATNILNKMININKDEYNHKYSYLGKTYELIETEDAVATYSLFATYDKKIYIGGFRNTNTIVYYDATNFRTRNEHGYEIAVDENGIVIDQNILVELPTNGYILSEHSTNTLFLMDYVTIGDKIEIVDGKIYVYRDYPKSLYNNLVTKRNEIVNLINEEINNNIPHDYIYIDSLLNSVDKYLNNIDFFNVTSLYDMQQLNTISSKVKLALGIIQSQLIDFKVNQTRGVWYYPFNRGNNTDDTSLEGVKATIKKLKALGYNEVIIYLFNGDYCLFESSVFKYYDKLKEYDYGEYGNDYLKCFIEEAHKEGICVNAFTQTFRNYNNAMINPNDAYYQIDFSGSKTQTTINYYDICNDNVHDFLITWYRELVTKYDFDKVEYDIIRYPMSNINTLGDEVITNEKRITDIGYTEYAMNDFMTKYGYTGDLKQLIMENPLVRKDWMEYKENKLISFITSTTQKMKEVKPDLVISAAVFSDYDTAKSRYLQDYYKWLDLGIVDELELMCYTNITSTLEERIEYHKFINNKKYDSIKYGLSARQVENTLDVDFLQMYLASKENGFVFYAAHIYTNDEIFNKILMNNHHAMSYHPLVKENINIYIYEDCIDMIENYFEISNNCSYDNLIKAFKTNDINKIINEINLIEDNLMKKYLLDRVEK